jgi:hypothetical protein
VPEITLFNHFRHCADRVLCLSLPMICGATWLLFNELGDVRAHQSRVRSVERDNPI